MQSKQGISIKFKHLLLPSNNHWQKRIALIFSFVFFDYFSTLVLCRMPSEEANLYARVFMETFGIPLGLTLFVLSANLPIYILLNLDSHLVTFPPKMAIIIEWTVEIIFAWFVAGLHFSGGASWFWNAPDLTRQIFGAILYLTMAFLVVKPLKPFNDN